MPYIHKRKGVQVFPIKREGIKKRLEIFEKGGQAICGGLHKIEGWEPFANYGTIKKKEIKNINRRR